APPPSRPLSASASCWPTPANPPSGAPPRPGIGGTPAGAGPVGSSDAAAGGTAGGTGRSGAGADTGAPDIRLAGAADMPGAPSGGPFQPAATVGEAAAVLPDAGIAGPGPPSRATGPS